MAFPPVAPNLREHWVRVHQDPPSTVLDLRDPVHVAQREVDVAFATALGELFPRHAVDGAVLSKIAPVISQAVRLEKLAEIGDPVAGVRRHDVPLGVIAGPRPAIVLEERHLVSLPLEPDEVL